MFISKNMTRRFVEMGTFLNIIICSTNEINQCSKVQQSVKRAKLFRFVSSSVWLPEYITAEVPFEMSLLVRFSVCSMLLVVSENIHPFS